MLTTLLHRMFFPPEQRDAKKADDAAERFKTPLGVLNGALAGKEHLLGNSFTVADLNVASVISWAPLAGLDLGSAGRRRAVQGDALGREYHAEGSILRERDFTTQAPEEGDHVSAPVRRPVRATLRVQRDHGSALVGRVLVGNLRRLRRQQGGHRVNDGEPEELANHGVLLHLEKSVTGSRDPPAHSRDNNTARARLRVISPSQVATDVLAVSTKRAALSQT